MRRRGTRWGEPPKPVTVVAPKLNTAGLQAAYEWMPVDQHLGFRMAYEWYNDAINPKTGVSPLLYQDPLNEDRQRAFDRATKAQNLGNHAGTDGERLHAWATGLRLYEKVWAAKPLPKIDEALAATQTSDRVRNITTVLSALNDAFAPCGVRFKVTLGTERDLDNSIIYLPQSEVEQLVGQPPLKTVLNEVTAVAQAISVHMVIATNEDGTVQTGPDGKPLMVPELDVAAFFANVPKVLAAVATWSEGYNGSLTKRVGKVVTANKAPRTPRVPSQAPAAASTSSLSPKHKLVHDALKNGTVSLTSVMQMTGWKTATTMTQLYRMKRNLGLRLVTSKNMSGETFFSLA